MEIIKGLFPLLFASFSLLFVINIVIFSNSRKKYSAVIILLSGLFISQFSEFLVCFYQFDITFLKFLMIVGIWIFPILLVSFVLQVIDAPKKLIQIFYGLVIIILLMLIANYSDINSLCSLFLMELRYPSQWLFGWFAFLFLIISGLKLNQSIKSIEDSIEIKKRRFILFSILGSLFLTVFIVILMPGSGFFLESILGKTSVFITTAISYYIIRDRYHKEVTQ
ncbi:MAG: hypothetical protein KKA84_06350 [Bacteroidetes bacterium]|nr:hypothetical protein [Bacteroidota bacterium]